MPDTSIFIVDSDQATTDLLRLELTRDFSVSVFKSAEDALAKLNEVIPKVIIFEYELPGINGIEFFEKIQELKSESTLLIMMSSLDDGNMVLKFIQKGVRNYIMKDDALVDSVNEVLQEEL